MECGNLHRSVPLAKAPLSVDLPYLDLAGVHLPITTHNRNPQAVGTDSNATDVESLGKACHGVARIRISEFNVLGQDGYHPSIGEKLGVLEAASPKLTKGLYLGKSS